MLTVTACDCVGTGCGAWFTWYRPGGDFLATAQQIEMCVCGVQAAQADSKAPPGIKPDTWTSVKLEEKKDVNYNTVHLRFGLESAEHTTNLNVASCLVVRAPIGDKAEDGSPGMVVRPYTPVTGPDSKLSLIHI